MCLISDLKALVHAADKVPVIKMYLDLERGVFFENESTSHPV